MKKINTLFISGFTKTYKYYGNIRGIEYFSIIKNKTPYEKLKHDIYYLYSTISKKGFWDVKQEIETPNINKSYFIHSDDSSILGNKIIKDNKVIGKDCINRNYPDLVFLAFSGEQLVGQTRINVGYNYSYIHNLRIHPHYRRNKISSHLTYFLNSEFFKNLQNKQLYSHDDARDGNGERIKIYEKYGKRYTVNKFNGNLEMIFTSNDYINKYLNVYLKDEDLKIYNALKPVIKKSSLAAAFM